MAADTAGRLLIHPNWRRIMIAIVKVDVDAIDSGNVQTILESYKSLPRTCPACNYETRVPTWTSVGLVVQNVPDLWIRFGNERTESAWLIEFTTIDFHSS